MRNINLELIYYTNYEMGWETNWAPLQDENGRYLTDMSDAIAYIRSQYANNGISHVGLADYEQMQLNNASWDNL